MSRKSNTKDYVLVRRRSGGILEIGKQKYSKKEALKTLKAVKAIGVDMEIMRHDVAVNSGRHSSK